MQDVGFEARIMSIERRARQTRVIALVLLACVALLAGTTATLYAGQLRIESALAAEREARAAGRESAREITVIDTSGAVRARLGVDAQDKTVLELLGPGGASALRLTAGETTGAIQLRDELVQRAELSWVAEETGPNRSTVRLTDRAGKTRAELVSGDAAPALNLYNEHGVATAGVP